MIYSMYVNKYKHVNAAKLIKLGQRKNGQRQEELMTEIPDTLLPPTQNCGE
jgi:hypothetical protein